MALQLRFRLQNGQHAIPLARVHSVAGYARLSGEADHYFRGWLRYHGEWTPVFDLNLVACEEPAPETFGTRIFLVAAGPDAPVRLIGLVAAGVTDTVAANDPDVTPFDLDRCLQMLVNLIPPAPVVAE
ncbi:MAG TPA: chemotaxis protein CheW [Terracidiphilus sp.]|jgi:chemotaxis signal transduction protein|nr:chemotaxis protein CheW [Terracidiphilus sp.]